MIVFIYGSLYSILHGIIPYFPSSRGPPGAGDASGEACGIEITRTHLPQRKEP